MGMKAWNASAREPVDMTGPAHWTDTDGEST